MIFAMLTIVVKLDPLADIDAAATFVHDANSKSTDDDAKLINCTLKKYMTNLNPPFYIMNTLKSTNTNNGTILS